MERGLSGVIEESSCHWIGIVKYCSDDIEFDELNHLLDQQACGEEINEDRLYELELRKKPIYVENLNELEITDLEYFGAATAPR